MHEAQDLQQPNPCEVFVYGRIPASARLIQDYTGRFAEEQVHAGDVPLIVVMPCSVASVETFNRDILPTFLIPHLPIISPPTERRRVGVYVGDDVTEVSNLRRSYLFPSEFVNTYPKFLEQIIYTILNEISFDPSFGRW